MQSYKIWVTSAQNAEGVWKWGSNSFTPLSSPSDREAPPRMPRSVVALKRSCNKNV